MSNLNVNNIDVQRIINVFQEFQWKMEICSCLTIQTFEKIRSKSEQIEAEFGKKIYSLLDNHYESMVKFRTNHLIYKEIKKEIEKSDEDNYLEVEDEGPKEILKEKQNLEEISELTSEFTVSLAKSTRNLYRELKGNSRLLQFMKELRSDSEIISFYNDLTLIISTDITKCKMTEEEEISEKELNTKLTLKIKELESQLNEKNNKLKKLIDDKSTYKNGCLSKLEEIKKEIVNLQKDTKDFLSNTENEINDYLNDVNKRHNEEINELNNELLTKNKEFKDEKEKNLKDEKLHSDNLFKAETDLSSHLKDFYDQPLFLNKEGYEGKLREDLEKEEEIKRLEVELMSLKEKTEVYEEAHKDLIQKKNHMESERKMLEFACSNIQSSFRGFFIRKTMKKKYKKILAGLVKPKPNMNPDPKGGNKNNGKK